MKMKNLIAFACIAFCLLAVDFTSAAPKPGDVNFADYEEIYNKTYVALSQAVEAVEKMNQRLIDLRNRQHQNPQQTTEKATLAS